MAVLLIALAMVSLARRATVAPRAAVVVPPASDGSAATSARLAIQQDLRKASVPLTPIDVAPDGRARGLSFPSGGGTVTYGLTASASTPGVRGLARNAGAIPGVYLRELSFLVVSPRMVQVDLTASDRDGRNAEPRLVVVTLPEPTKVK